MKYLHIFFDLDHTLWDFDTNARETLYQLHCDLQLAERGVHDFDLFLKHYLEHNDRLWERYRKGLIRQDELRLKRMVLTLLEFQIADDALCREMNDLFLQLLPTRTRLFPDTKEVLQYLTDKGYALHLITNGFDKVQHSKLKSSGLHPYFREVVTSECSNSLKPEPAIFEYALSKARATVHESIMIGDSLEVDIAGAKAIGMDSIHTNYLGTVSTIKPTYTVTALSQLKDIL